MTAAIATPVTLDQLAALCDEMRALVRAGVPLDRGLRELARELPGKMQPLVATLGTRLESGQPLELAVAEELGKTLPAAYGAVLVAGMRAGRLPVALEEVASTSRMVGQLRQSIGAALCYPLVVLSLTWVLGIIVLLKVAPVMSQMLREFRAVPDGVVQILEKVIGTAPLWGLALPILAVLWLAWAWRRSGQVTRGVELHPLLSFGAVGMLANLRRSSQLGALARLLALLLENEVPLPEAVELASAAVGSKRIAEGGRRLAAQLRSGEVVAETPAGFPPLLAWMLTRGRSAPQLVQSLKRTAEVYRDEVSRRSQWLAFYVPVVLSIALCGGIVLVYALLTLGPWILIMRQFTRPYGLTF